MKTADRTKLEMLLSVKDFGTANRERFPEGSIGARAFAIVAAVAAEVADLAGRGPVKALDGRKAQAAARQAARAAMRDIVRTAKGLELAPGATNPLLLPRAQSSVAVLTAGRTLVAEADAFKDQLLLLGLPGTALADLDTRLDVLESTMEARRSGRAAVAEVQARMRDAFARAAQALDKLDAVVPNAVNGDPGLLAAWERRRRVVRRRVSSPPSEAATGGDTPSAVTSPPEPAAPDSVPQTS